MPTDPARNPYRDVADAAVRYAHEQEQSPGGRLRVGVAHLIGGLTAAVESGEPASAADVAAIRDALDQLLRPRCYAADGAEVALAQAEAVRAEHGRLGLTTARIGGGL